MNLLNCQWTKWNFKRFFCKYCNLKEQSYHSTKRSFFCEAIISMNCTEWMKFTWMDEHLNIQRWKWIQQTIDLFCHFSPFILIHSSVIFFQYLFFVLLFSDIFVCNFSIYCVISVKIFNVNMCVELLKKLELN